ncbi:hypothetical protein [Photorhabdus heterorhabditis]|uniref:hypothetical protein n=1 Tax=Photorhabdus heterorhabditis TaxID=880156 RepID=UPI001BD21CAF|nr:hypothetical protein [Photorhabdus heterorhabditis]MBS9440743.1 hypothetical protein [Photorhabdus heterorhabditis]
MSTEKDLKINIKIDELKNRFKEGSIPLQTDFADLIDIADIGRRAVGKAPDQIENPNSALELKDDSGLAVKVNANGGLQANENGISVKIKDQSLLSDTEGLAVNTGKGLWINKGKLEVDNHDGIEIVNEGVKVKASDGINVNNSGVSVKASDGINVNSSGVSVKAKMTHGGIAVNKEGVSIIPDTTTGIMITDKGLGIYLGNGLKCDDAGGRLYVDINAIASTLANLIIPKGTIVPFYSDDNNPPSGWAWCDGNNSTPNLNRYNDNDYSLFFISGSNSRYSSSRGFPLGVASGTIYIHYMRYIMKI